MWVLDQKEGVLYKAKITFLKPDYKTLMAVPLVCLSLNNLSHKKTRKLLRALIKMDLDSPSKDHNPIGLISVFFWHCES